MKAQSIIFRLSKATVVAVLLLAVTAAAHAATVRGRLDRISPNGRTSPAVGFAVTVSRPNLGRSAPAYSNRDGMYYLQNIAPGTYNLEIWITRGPGTRPKIYVIQVHEPLTDIPAIRF